MCVGLCYGTEVCSLSLLSRRPLNRMLKSQASVSCACRSQTVAQTEQTVARWRLRDHRLIVATSAFAADVNYPSVLVVIHQGLPSNAIDFA